MEHFSELKFHEKNVLKQMKTCKSLICNPKLDGYIIVLIQI